MQRISRALISVSDKSGLVEFATELAALGIRILSTGGTARTLAEHGIPVTEVADYTGFPEMLDGRVKTLHPKVHGGLLARRDVPEHMQSLADHGIDPIDLLVVNLYPFEQTVARADCTLAEAIENIDIGGPTMLRAAAKNHAALTVVVDPADYGAIATSLRESGGVSDDTRYELARKVFSHTARYDAAISNYLGSHGPAASAYPPTFTQQWEKVQDLRYGENPHQSGAFYRDLAPAPGSLANYRQLQGKELSYNNIADSDAAWECVRTFETSACVIVKHANPCGAAVGADCAEAYAKALACDPTSAFGGILAFNRPLDAAAAQLAARQFVEVLIAPGFSPDALAVFAAKPNVRVLEIPLAVGVNPQDFKRVGGGLLVQSPDSRNVAASELRVITRRQPSEEEFADLLFAWRVAKFVKSNAIVFCAGGRTLGVGAGQMSRIDSARIAAIKAANAGLSLVGSAAASDAFFPFRDGLDAVADAGATAVIQPGGSMRDDEVIAAADERGMAMVLTGMRHFRH